MQRRSKHNFNSGSCSRKAWGESKIPKPKAPKSIKNPDKPSTYMNPTISREINMAEKTKIRGEAQKILKEGEIKTMNEWKFQPEINVNEAFEEELTQEERWRRLLEPKTTKIQQYEKAKVEKERKKIEETCSFQPNTQQKSWETLKRKPKDFVKRLHSEASKRQEKREKLKRKLEEERMKDCSFKPKIENPNRIGNPYSSCQKPIYERVDEIQRNKAEYLSKLKVEAELNDEHLKFQPRVNKNSEKILTKKSKMNGNNKSSNVVERLTHDTSNRIEKVQMKADELNNEISSKYPFKPQTSTYSTMSIDNKNFYERQQDFLHKKHEKQEQHRNDEGKQYSFKPKINTTSGVIIEADPERCQETQDEKYHRLYNHHFTKAEETRQNIEEELYGKYTYQPAINPLSRVMAAERMQGDFLELTQNTKSTLTHSVHHELEHKQKKEWTFKPKINKNYQGVHSAYTNKEELKAKLQEKAFERRQKEEQK